MMSEVKCDTVVCKQLIVNSEDGDYSATIRGMKGGVGFWMTRKGDKAGMSTIAIYKIGDHTVIGLYDGEKEEHTAIDMGICTAEKAGDAFFQVSPKSGNVVQITPDEFKKLAEQKAE